MKTIRIIIEQFRKEPHKVIFVETFSKVLADFRYAIAVSKIEQNADDYRRREWEFKRWFWSFLENAVPLHTKTIHVTKEQLQNYDVALVVKSLKSFGVEIKEE